MPRPSRRCIRSTESGNHIAPRFRVALRVLVLNAGSSSVKSRLYILPLGDLPETPIEAEWKGAVEWQAGRGMPRDEGERVLERLLEPVRTRHGLAVDVVGHRVVHGGEALRATTPVTPSVLEQIRLLAEFAPGHNPTEALAIEFAIEAFGPEVTQVAVFDTAFHATLPPAVYTYAGPPAWRQHGIRRYGFHGLSHHSAARRGARLVGADWRSLRIVTCHLGSGCSLAAVRNGACVDTTMGFTTLEGLVMGTRSGSVDPGILLFLMRRGATADDLDRMLNRESGLLGVSGLSADIRRIEEAMAEGHEGARLAFDVFAHRARAGVAAMAAGAGGLDLLVFTGGIGENSAAVREAVCTGLGFLGVRLDAKRNREIRGDGNLTETGSTVRVAVVKAEEEWEIARECARVFSGGGST